MTVITTHFNEFPVQLLAALLLSVLLLGCSSGEKDTKLRPDPVDSITTNRGDGAISVGWEYSGDPAVSFVVELDPTPASASTTISGQTALIQGLANNVNYTLSVRTRSTGLLSDAVSASVNPMAVDTANYTALTVNNDPSLSGIFDPSFYRDNSGTIWMAYSGVDYYQAGGFLVQDVSTRLARSDDGGMTFTLVTTLGTAQDVASVTDTSGTLGCAANTCSGRWVYEVPFIVDDANAPNASERFKIYAHKYLLMPSASSATVYFLGAIVRWTAPTPDSAWPTEEVVMRWNFTPPELVGGVNLNQLASQLSDCLLFSEGGASVGAINNQTVTESVFSCAYIDAGSSSIRQRIVQFRTADHDQSFSYTGEVLSANDAAISGASYYSAPSLLPRIDSAPVILVTSVINGLYAGCEVFSYTDFATATLARDSGEPISLLTVPQLATNFGGACAWDRGLNSTGITLNNVNVGNAKPFTVLNTDHPL